MSPSLAQTIKNLTTKAFANSLVPGLDAAVPATVRRYGPATYDTGEGEATLPLLAEASATAVVRDLSAREQAAFAAAAATAGGSAGLGEVATTRIFLTALQSGVAGVNPGDEIETLGSLYRVLTVTDRRLGLESLVYDCSARRK